MRSLQGNIVLITGAGGGFGQAMIRQFLQEGCQLVLADLSRDKILQAVEYVTATPGDRALTGKILGFIAADLANPVRSEALYRQCLAITPRVDMLINNAGIACFGRLADVPQERWEQLMQINLLAPMRLTAKFLPDMIARRSGYIVNISSVAGLIGVPGLSSYCTSKFGLRGFGEALAAELTPYGIGVTNIYPYFARTPILQAERFGSMSLPAPPDQMLYDPEFVIAKLIKGIREQKLHIYPGAIPQLIDCLQRLAPWALPLVLRPSRSRRKRSAATKNSVKRS
ncbi:MAG: SDR family oxidoreductase [Chloroflexales bacterium]|nr:SDR family oxidoreductase [Chloroflexales bacterium]